MQDKQTKASCSKNTNQSSGRLLELIEYLSVQQEPMRISDIALGCGFHVSTVHRFLSALLVRGYAVRDLDTGRYSLTFKFCRVGSNIKSNTDLRSLCRAHLRELSRTFGGTVSLAIEYDMAVMYLETLTGPLLSSKTGEHASGIATLHSTAGGKLFLSGYNARLLEQFLAVKGMPAHTANTLTTLQQLRKELLKIRGRGFAYDNEESEPGQRGVAAPIKDYTNQVVATLCVQGPAALMTDPYIQRGLPLLLGSAGQISSRMGYDPTLDFLPTYRR